MPMRSVMEHSFSNVPKADIPRSSFNRSHGLKTTFDADYLVPILVDEVLPGDTFNVKCTHFLRLATPLHPIMDNMYAELFFFFVPTRLVWDNWEKFCGAQDNPADSIDFTIPAINSATSANITSDTYDLLDYMGLPHTTVNLSEINVLPFRCFNLIWNEWFRDQNLQDSINIDKDDGPDTLTDFVMRKRGKRHDYFTSCLPWPQKAGNEVSLPLGDTATVQNTTAGYDIIWSINDGAANASLFVENDGNVRWSNTGSGFGVHELEWSNNATQVNLEADLSGATAATINDLRLAFQTQKLLERDARSGTRYNETILAHFGVTVPDFRVQRPEFLGGGSHRINVTPVAQTSGQPTPASDDALGLLAAYGTSGGASGFTKSFTEHGYLLGLINVRGDITYSQGLERMWSRSTRYDFYYPVLSQIGEQAVLNSEIYYQNNASDDAVFGYQERYAEYRYKPSRLSQLMRPDHAGTLESWHLSEDFASLPTLGDTFIQSNTGAPLDRAIAVSTEPHFIGDFFFSMKCARPMPLYGIPGNMDRF